MIQLFRFERLIEIETLVAEADMWRDGVVGGEWFQGVPVIISIVGPSINYVTFLEDYKEKI